MCDWLLIDHGNSRIKWALSDGRKYTVLPTVAASLEGLANMQQTLSVLPNQPAQSLITSVGSPTLHAELKQMLSPNIQCQHPIKQKAFLGLTLGYPDISQLGLDRWLAMLGARAKHPHTALVVVSVGTAMTVDAIDPSGQHLGGMIAPSPWLAWHGIHQRIPTLPEAPKRFASTTRQLGDDTQSCLQAGAVAACVGVIEQAVLLCADAAKQTPCVVISGGGYEVLKDWLKTPHVFETNLLFDGMQSYLRAAFP